MDAYVYQAALLCTPCALAAMLGREAQNIVYGSDYTHQFWPHTWQESDSYPQGPYADGGGEADSPQHCDHCGLFLETP